MARFQLKWGSTDITSDVINYRRSSSICEGTKTLTIELVNKERAFTTWDTFTLWEDGHKVGIFYAVDITKTHENVIKIPCQDASLKLERHFEDRIWNPGWISNAKYWISLWLDRAGVSYNFTASGNGAVTNKDVTFGNSDTKSMIVPLLQQSGWYMIFDGDNVLQIGKLDVDTKTVSASFDETDIITISYDRNDSNARNKVIVWGGRDLSTDTWITGVAESDADWQIDSNDDRTVVISSNAIRNYASSYYIANQLLNSTIEISKEKELTLTGFRNVQVGDLVFISSRIFNGTGLITDIEVNADSSSGYITRITLDRRCPRLFAYFAWDGYVYAGTVGGGVYRKPFEVDSWSAYNTGLENLNIKDLYVKNGILACVAGGYAYKSTVASGIWVKLSHGQFTDQDDNTYEENEVIAKFCTIDDFGTVIVGYTNTDTNYSWIVHYNLAGGIVRKEQIVVGDEDTFPMFDGDNNGEITFIGTTGEGLVNVETIYVDGLTTCRNVWVEAGGSPFDRRPVAKPSINNYNTTITMDSGTTTVNQSVLFDGIYTYYGSAGATYRFSGCTRYDIEHSITTEVQLPVSNDCYYATTSIIDENTAIHVVQEENVGIKIFLVDFSLSTATLKKTFSGTYASPPIQTHTFENGNVLVVFTDASNTYMSLYSNGSASDLVAVLSEPFTKMQATTGGRITPYSLYGDKIALVGIDGLPGDTIVGCVVSNDGSYTSEDSFSTANPATESFNIYQFCPKSDYTSLYLLVYYSNNTYVYELNSAGSFSSVYSSTGWTNPKLSSWKGGTYLIETDNITATVNILEGTGYSSITSSVQENDRISPRSDDHDGAFIIYDRSEHELKRHRGTDVTILADGLDDTGYIWLAGSSVITESQRIYASLSGSILISGSAGAVVRHKYYDDTVLVSGEFTIILDGVPSYTNVEASRAVPIMAYTTNGYMYGLYAPDTAVDIDDWFGLPQAYRLAQKQGRVYFRESEDDGSFSGLFFATTVDDMNLRAFNTTLDSESEIIFSGAVITSGSKPLHRVETSNGTDPYFFVSTSGGPSLASQFFQKNPNSSIFVEQSTGLPSNNIRIIRVDDRIS